jgi:ABC-type transport system involved in cytochrome c biogenesis permease subunit
MTNLLDSLDIGGAGILASSRWLHVVDLFCALGILFAAASAWRHAVQQRRVGRGLEPGRNPFATAALSSLVGALVAASFSVWNRYVEVNHFPSQTMSEVLVMFSSGLLVSMLVLHFALKLRRMGLGWAVVDDALLLLVFAGAWATNYYSGTLSTAQRDLPPALQSYWFPPHLISLIFSYATMGIAGAVCLVYFATRFWTGVWGGGRSLASQLWLLAALVLVPFVQVVTIPAVVIVGLVFAVLKWKGLVPGSAALVGFERKMAEVSYRAFSVGIPFLTAGLFMGAFWAQEAWANYWGWDSKENSALITWLVYVGYIHLRMLGGYRGEKAMAVLMGGALSVFLTFQIFGYLPDSQKSLHRYTDDGVVPREGMQGAGGAPATESARLEAEADGR